MSESAIFMIEGGRALDMVQHHISERSRVHGATKELADTLGIREGVTCRETGVLQGVRLKSPHPDFKKPNSKGVSFPKKGSEWAKKLHAQVGYEPVMSTISRELGVPLDLSYRGPDCSGSCCIGSPFNSCGFLWLNRDGPFAMWLPDVERAVADKESTEGYVVDEPAKSFRMEFEGCRRILQEEWDMLVAQFNLEEARALAGGASNG